MKTVTVVGAGKIGSTIADILHRSGDYEVTLVDNSEARLADVAKLTDAKTRVADVTKPESIDGALADSFAVLNALPYQLTQLLAESAARTRTHYFDLTEDVASTRIVKELAKDADTAFIPQCGLAPGFVSIAAYDVAKSFDRLDEVRMRVGALTQHPTNAINYNLTWSTEGVINEYIEPCEAIMNGKFMEVPALEGHEEFSIDGVRYEAFNTSGGLGTMCHTLDGKVRNLNYRSIRYPGHHLIMKALLQDLRLADRRELLCDIFHKAVPATEQDVVIIFITVTGWRGENFMQETLVRKVYAGEYDGVFRTGIQATTSYSVCAVLDMLVEGTIPQSGFVRQEDIDLNAFLANRFGRVYAGAATNDAMVA
jgi:saccharopine dehydrogenase-like NADP-dependent oxidoreductase